MSSLEITIPNYYIAKGKNGKEQIVKYHQKYYNKDNKIFYEGNYGIFGYHEVFTFPENMRELTKEEKEFQSKKEFWKLPQNFYQSIPDY